MRFQHLDPKWPSAKTAGIEFRRIAVDVCMSASG